MTQEEKELLIKDLSARLPYGIIASVRGSDEEFQHFHILGVKDGKVWVKNDILRVDDFDDVEVVKPYLRSMSSITEEERDEIEEMSHGWFYVNEDGEIFPMGQFTDSGEFEDAILPTLEWLNKKMFDYRGLIPMGLALEAPTDMYQEE